MTIPHFSLKHTGNIPAIGDTETKRKAECIQVFFLLFNHSIMWIQYIYDKPVLGTWDTSKNKRKKPPLSHGAYIFVGEGAREKEGELGWVEQK